MPQINFVIILFIFLFVLIDGIDEDLFDDLWKNQKPSTSKNFKKQKFGKNYAIKEEIVDNNEIHEQQNFNKIKMEDIKPKKLQNIKKEQLEDENNNLKIKVPKIELDKLNEDPFEKEFNEQVDQNISYAEQSNSANEEAYNNTNRETRNKMEILNEFNLMKKELRKESVYKNLSHSQLECEIAKKLGISRKKIYKWKNEFGLLREFSNQQKIVKVKQFEKVKKEFTKKFNSKTNWKINGKIAEKIGVKFNTIRVWKRNLNLTTRKTKIYTDADKLEYVKRIEEMTERNPMMKKKKIAEKLGIPIGNISRWTKKFGTKAEAKRIFYTDAEKLEYVKRSEEMKIKNPMISERKIANEFGIPNSSLSRWTKELGTKSIH